jgi:hypothetical protein
MGRKSGMASALLWTPKAWSIVAISFEGAGPNEPLAHFAVTGAICRGALVAATRADRLGAAVGRAAAQEYLQRLETAGEASAAASHVEPDTPNMRHPHCGCHHTKSVGNFSHAWCFGVASRAATRLASKCVCIRNPRHGWGT